MVERPHERSGATCAGDLVCLGGQITGSAAWTNYLQQKIKWTEFIVEDTMPGLRVQGNTQHAIHPTHLDFRGLDMASQIAEILKCVPLSDQAALKRKIQTEMERHWQYRCDLFASGLCFVLVSIFASFWKVGFWLNSSLAFSASVIVAWFFHRLAQNLRIRLLHTELVSRGLRPYSGHGPREAKGTESLADDSRE